MEEVAELIFELSSEDRISLLLHLYEKDLKLTKLAEDLDITTSETSRHLNRLLKIGAVEKNRNGNYSLNSLGKLLVKVLPYFEFLNEKREYVTTHDLGVIPTEFLTRLGQLKQSIIVSGFYGVMDTQMEAVSVSASKIWIMSPEVLKSVESLLTEKVVSGVDVRLILPENAVDDSMQDESDNEFNIRFLPTIDCLVAVLDTRGGICFPNNDGVVNLSDMIAGRDESSLRWFSDVFTYYWKLAESR